MADEEFYLVEIESGNVLRRWRCGHLSRSEKGALRHKLRAEFRVYDTELGLDLRWTADDERAPWE